EKLRIRIEEGTASWWKVGRTSAYQVKGRVDLNQCSSQYMWPGIWACRLQLRDRKGSNDAFRRQKSFLVFRDDRGGLGYRRWRTERAISIGRPGSQFSDRALWSGLLQRIHAWRPERS